MAYASGTCGDNVTWELSDDGVLTLSGTGATYDYDDPMYEGNKSPLSDPLIYLNFEMDHGGACHFSAVVNSGITRLGNNVLAGAPIESVSLPGTLTEIGQGALESGKLTSVSIPSSVTKIEKAAFRFNYLANIEIPHGLTEIPMSAFLGNELTSVTIPAWVTRIESGAFADCKIKNVTIPTGVTFCCYDAFDSDVFESFIVESGNNDYSAVDGVLFNAGKTELIRYPEAKQTADYHYDIPEGVLAIGYNSFRGALYLSSVSMPDTVTEVGGWAFDGVPLTSVKLSQNLSVVEISAFAETGITSIDLPDTLVTIDGYAFEKTKLSAVTLPENLAEIGSYAFDDTKITSVVIPSKVESIGASAFPPETMVSYTVDAENQHYSSQDGILFNADKTELRIYPACKTGEEYTVPDGVTTITATAFDYVSYLQKVILPNSVTTISGSAFGSTSSGHIVTLELCSKTPPAVTSSTLAVLTTIIVPYGTGDKYKAAEGWKDYAAIIVEAKGFPLRQFILGILSELTAGSAKEPIAYLYNGVRLPKLPEWDRGVYPFAVILIYESYLTKKYTAILYLMKVNNIRQAVETGGGGVYFEYMYYQVGDIQYSAEFKDGEVVTEWGEPAVLTESLSFNVARIKWANSDIVLALDTTSGAAGTLYLAASDPVPVYE